MVIVISVPSSEAEKSAMYTLPCLEKPGVIIYKAVNATMIASTITTIFSFSYEHIPLLKSVAIVSDTV